MARPRKSVDVADVKSMLLMADREWGNNGLIPQDNGGATYGGSYMAMRFLDAYRGDYPSALPAAVEEVDEFVGNLFFSIVNTVLAQVSAVDPEPIVRPLGGTAADPGAWRRAWLNQKTITAMMRERKFRREIDRAIQCALILPFGLVRHGMTPEVEYIDNNGITIAQFKNQTPDLPWIQFIRPWEVRMDPFVNSFDMDGECRWIAFRKLYRSRSEIASNENLIHTDDWKPTFNYDLRPYHERRKPRAEHSGVINSEKSKDFISMFEEWVVYDFNKQTFFGVSHGCDKLVREEREWPVNWGQLPASIITFNQQLDSPFGVPFPKMIWHELGMYNTVWTILKALVKRIRRVIFVNSSAFNHNAAQLENLLNPDSLMEFVLADGMNQQIVQEIGFGNIDGQIVGLLYQLKEQIREVMGVSSFDRGQRANVQTAAEANQIGAGGQMARNRILAHVENFWVDALRASHRALLNSEDGREFIVPIIGEQNFLFLSDAEVQQGFVKATIKDLTGEFDYGVKHNSTTPLDPGAEFMKVLQLNQALGGQKNPIINPVYVAQRMVTVAGEDEQKWVVPQAMAEKIGQQPDQGEQGDTGQAPQMNGTADMAEAVSGPT